MRGIDVGDVKDMIVTLRVESDFLERVCWEVT